MFTRVHSFVLQGIEAVPCEIEADIAPSPNPKTTIVGLPDAAVRESAERVRSALSQSGHFWPDGRVTINLAPADLRKEGPVYDLPVALAILLANRGLPVGGDDSLGAIVGASPPGAGGELGAGGPRVGPGVGPRTHASSITEAVAILEAEAVDLPPPIDPDDVPPRRTIEVLAPASSGRRRGGAGDPANAPNQLQLPNLEDWLIAGELALDGRLRPVRGVISLSLLAKAQGRRGVIVPRDNAEEAAVVDGIEVRSATHLREVIAFMRGHFTLPSTDAIDVETIVAHSALEVDFGDIRGQEAAKRAITIAAAGGHNILLIGPAGTGKTMMARALPGILPPLSRDEALEVTRVHSSVGPLPRGQPIVSRRPVRAPHHTASVAAVVGGGSVPRPGEVSLAHRGVLFLDELPEFSRGVLESLREPLEDGHVTIARAHSSIRFPAQIMLIAAMNPTTQGGGRVEDVRRDPGDRYLNRLSGPLVDRIDLHVEVGAVPFRQLSSERRGTDTASMRIRVETARKVQRARQATTLNAELSGRRLDKLATLDPAAREMLGRAMSELGLSARAYDKLRRIARTIADLEGHETVTVSHVAEAVQYRLLDRAAAGR